MSRREHTPHSRSRALRRVRAILASGIVFGVGAASTLAAWTDREHATATFSAGSFGIEGATNGIDYAEHADAAGAAALDFTVAALELVPGQTVYAGFSVRTVAGSVAGTAQLSADDGNDAGLGAFLRYGVRTIGETNCDATTFAAGSEVVPTGSAPTTNSSTTQELAAAAGSIVTYCFAVTLPDSTGNEAQGQEAVPRWVVTAQSE